MGADEMSGAGALTARGWTMAVAGLALCAGSLLVGQRDLLWPGLFLTALPVVSAVLVALSSRRLALHRSISPHQVVVGEPASCTVVLRQDGVGPGAVYIVEDHLPPALGDGPSFVVPFGIVGGARQLDYQVRAQWRGRHQVGPISRGATDGLGLVQRWRVLPGTAELTVTPRVFALAPSREASGVGASADTDVLRTSLVGPDDVLIRDYRSGDDVRRIHWRSTARTGQLMVRREERSWDPSAVVLVDNRRVHYGESVPDDRFEWVVSAAASICLHLQESGFSVSVADASGQVVRPEGVDTVRTPALLLHLTDLPLVEQDSLMRAVSGSQSGVRGQLMIAILAHLDLTDMVALRSAHRDRRTCWALVVDDAPVSPESSRAALALHEAGWHVERVDAATPVAVAWESLGRGGTR